ncbi:MAG: endonuclease [Oscillospiraceae bacterium]|nr:endonuclease [Oscillospiraceae bacterium]
MTETRTSLPSYSETLSLFAFTDASGGSSEPLLFYSDGRGACQRGRIWPDERGNFLQDGAGRDLHHLRPTNAGVNGVRDELCFGNVRETLQEYETYYVDERPVLWYQKNWNSGIGLVEPRDEVKGDVARILLYVWTVYGGPNGENQNLWVDQSPSGSGVEFNSGKRVIASRALLLDWCLRDPVDTWELGRNDVVQSIQGNRNVFIDYPELCWLMLGEEIPDMPTPSGWAQSLNRRVTAVAEPQEGGTVTVSGSTVTAEPKPGYEIAGWSLNPANAATVSQTGNSFLLENLQCDCCLTVRFVLQNSCGEEHSWDAGIVSRVPTQREAGEVRYTCTRCGAVRTEEIPFRFADVTDEQSYYFVPVYWALQKEPPITCGTDESHFSPHRLCSRAEALCLLWRAAGAPEPAADTSLPFQDVPDQAYYRKAVLWALESRITLGTSALSFSPEAPCTRAEALTFLWRAAKRPQISVDCPFVDLDGSEDAREAIVWAYSQKITNGTEKNRFSPNEVCTRAQMLSFLYRSS